MRRTRRGSETRRAAGLPAIAVLALATLSAILLALARFPASAQEVPAPAADAATGAPQSLFMGLRAGLFGKTTLEERHYQYAVHPGASLSDSVDVINFTEQQRTFTLYGADLVQGKEGVAPSFPADRQREAGAWIHLDRDRVSLGPKGQTNVHFTVNVPEDVAPGDHLGAVVASYKPPPKPGTVVVESRVALIVRVRIPGVAKLDGAVGPLRLGSGRGARRFTVEVRNTGNLLLTTLGRVEITKGRQTIKLVPVKPKQIYVIPGGKAEFQAVYKGTPPFGKRAATAVFALSAYKERDIKRASNTLTMSFFSWLLLLLLMTVICLVLLWWYRRRRSDSERDPAQPPAVDAVVAAGPASGARRIIDADAGADSREWYS